MKTHLAIDFGGTRSRAALFDAELRLLRRAETPSKVEEGMGPGLKRLIDLGTSVIEPGDKPASIGIAAPGPLDAETGVIIRARTLPGWSEVPLAKTISGAFDNLPTFLQNDANLGALAEYHLGAGQGADPMIYLTISTGLGGGVIINGQLFTGWRSHAIEPGHMRFSLPDGSHRRWEELVSGTALGDWARFRLRGTDSASSLRGLPHVDGSAVGEAALAGDPLAQSVAAQAGRWLGFGLVNLLHLFNPAAVVIGGSASKLGDLLLDPARAIIREHILHDDFYYDGLIRPAAFAEDMCLIGAALHAKLQLGGNASGSRRGLGSD